MAYLNTFLSLVCEHVEIRRHGQERLLIVLGTSQFFHCLILIGCRHVEIGRYGQKRLLIVVGTSGYFLSLACRTWQRLSKKIIDYTWHITILPYPYPGVMFKLEGMVKNYY